MTPAEWAAWIGAGAWVPQIAKWLHQRFAKPVIEIFSAPNVQIGYTNFGPVINLTSNIIAKRKDSIVDRITMEVTHGKGDSRTFTWVYLTETQQQITSYTGVAFEISKSQPAIALKVSTLAPVDKIIIFIDMEFQAVQRQHIAKILDTYNFLSKKDEKNALSELLNTKEVSDWLDFFRKSMYWKEGSYNVKVLLRDAGTRQPQVQQFEFSLARHEFEALNCNLGLVEKSVSEIIYPSSDESKKVEPINWLWVRPEIRRIP